ncbi:hypothetical protein C8E02_0963 [Vogesella indigofera]|uniref:Uncharacterized protein n=1 Tax=Vogesella indigofera TaxID=45465 RepID=A0A495BIX8_VOGIN|nr:hypothetical protein C8E02_0963 [Vogesella indigofera]
MDDIVTLPVKWVRADAYCRLTGEPMEAVLKRAQDGIWAAGKHYKRTGPRTLWINLIEATKWVDQQPHVESSFPRGSKSGSGNTAAA